MARGERRIHLRRRRRKWLEVNGESIYGAGATPFGAELGEVDNTTKDKRGNPGFEMARDWRCTTKPDKLFVHLFTWPNGAFELSKVEGKVKKAYLLADAQHAALKMKQAGGKVSVA